MNILSFLLQYTVVPFILFEPIFILYQNKKSLFFPNKIFFNFLQNFVAKNGLNLV
jgi:hypothetical protein